MPSTVQWSVHGLDGLSKGNPLGPAVLTGNVRPSDLKAAQMAAANGGSVRAPSMMLDAKALQLARDFGVENLIKQE